MKASVYRPLEGVDRIVLQPETDDDRAALEWLRDNQRVYFGNDPKTMRVLYVEIPIAAESVVLDICNAGRVAEAQKEAGELRQQLAELQAKHERLHAKAQIAFESYDGNGEEWFNEVMDDLGAEIHGR